MHCLRFVLCLDFPYSLIGTLSLILVLNLMIGLHIFLLPVAPKQRKQRKPPRDRTQPEPTSINEEVNNPVEASETGEILP